MSELSLCAHQEDAGNSFIDVEIPESGKSLYELRRWLLRNPNLIQSRQQIPTNEGLTWVEADGRPVQRDVVREREVLANYLYEQSSAHPIHYSLVQNIAAKMAPMSENCRLAINVPAWLEETSLPLFLEQFTKQVDSFGKPVNPEIYEINILLNRRTGEAPDNSISVIENFIRESLDGPAINYFDIELDFPHNNVGYARKLLTDAVVLRSIQRAEQKGTLYIQSEDADTVRIDSQQVVRVIDKLDANPHLDAVRGMQDRMPEYLMQNDMLFLSCRLRDFLEAMTSRRAYRNPRDPEWNFSWNRIVTGGWNTAFSAEAYGLIEGYEPVPSGEDMSLGQRISMVRGDGHHPNLEVIGRLHTRAEGSPRRFINQVIKGRDAYEDFNNDDDNHAIRSRSIPEAMEKISRYERINPEIEAILNNFAQELFDDFRDVTLAGGSRSEVISSVMFWLGFEKDDFTLCRDRIRIHNWQNVKKAIDDYRTKAQQQHIS